MMKYAKYDIWFFNADIFANPIKNPMQKICTTFISIQIKLTSLHGFKCQNKGLRSFNVKVAKHPVLIFAVMIARERTSTFEIISHSFIPVAQKSIN